MALKCKRCGREANSDAFAAFDLCVHCQDAAKGEEKLLAQMRLKAEEAAAERQRAIREEVRSIIAQERGGTRGSARSEAT